MAVEIPGWVTEQTGRDIATVKCALAQIESSVQTLDAHAKDLTRRIQAVRRAVRHVEQDTRYAEEFVSAMVQRSGGAG